MSRATLMQSNFNGGELSPLILGRQDVAKYANGCARMENFLPLVQGPAITRPGFRFVAATKTGTDRAWLVRFEFSISESYMLEFGDRYIRFYFNRAPVIVTFGAPYNPATGYVLADIVLSGGDYYYCIAPTTGNAPPNATYWKLLDDDIYEVPSPYTVADLTNDDGSFALRYVQTGDVIYFAHPSYPPYTLSRFGPIQWRMEPVAFDPPPFKAYSGLGYTVYASAATGSGVTLTASFGIFAASMVGQYIKLAEKDVRSTAQWEAGKSINAGDVRRSDGKNYVALNTATTGGVKPTHGIGAAFDGDTGVQWEYLDSGYGIALITGYTSTTQVTCTVVSRLPANCVGSGNPTTYWALQAWSATEGYPSCVTFFRERLVYARGATIWFSVTGDFPNFATEIDGSITADSGFDRTLSSDRTNSIRWMSPGDVLLIGTAGDEWAVVENSATEAFGPANVRTKAQSTYGSSYVAPARVADVTLFMQKAGRKMRAMAFRYEEDGFKSDDATVYASHLTRAGIIDIAYQQEPQGIVWCARADGVLVGMTFNREQEVVAWHKHPLSGGTVESVECIPSPSGAQDDLWVIVRYTVNGATKRYIAYLDDIDEDGNNTAQASWVFSDMALTYSGAAASTITGLDHLEGKEVWILANGAYHPNRTVSGGAITLQYAATPVVVGLPCPAVLETMPLNPGGDDGTSQGKIKRVHQVMLRVLNTLRALAGPSDGNTKRLQGRHPSVPMGSAPPAYTGLLQIDWPGDYDRDQTVIVEKDSAMPIRVVSVIPSVQTNTR